jgi:hypothetical protein
MATLPCKDKIQICIMALVVVSVKWFIDLLDVFLDNTNRQLAEEL